MLAYAPLYTQDVTISVYPTHAPTVPKFGSDADIAIFSAPPPSTGDVYSVGIDESKFIGAFTVEKNRRSVLTNHVSPVSVHVAPLR